MESFAASIGYSILEMYGDALFDPTFFDHSC
jgi:hypothetical protein